MVTINLNVQREDDEYLSGLHLTSREKRFIKFASVEYHGQLYMTPQDFLESFVDEQPRGKYTHIFIKVVHLSIKLF